MNLEHTDLLEVVNHIPFPKNQMPVAQNEKAKIKKTGERVIVAR